MKKNIFCFLLILPLFFIVGCTPINLKPIAKIDDNDQKAEVLLFRESGFNAKYITLIFGENKADYGSLDGGEYVRLYLKSGETNLFVRSDQADIPYVLNVNLIAGEKRCFKAYANPLNYLKLVVFFYFGNTFKLQEVNCFSAAEKEIYIHNPNKPDIKK